MYLINKPNRKKILVIFLILIFIESTESKNWGFYAHKKINEMAIYTLPESMRAFYLENMEKIISYAILPDQRRYILDEEAEKHYMDLDYYKTLECFKADTISYREKYLLISKEDLKQHGIAGWNLPKYYKLLVKAFSEKNKEEILKKSAELGHYLADLHVPLHTTSNYDGQKTGQTGLHSLWESKIPEYVKEDLFQFVGKAEYIQNMEDSSWKWLWMAHEQVDELIEKEKKVSKSIPNKKQYVYEKRGNNLIRMESEIFIKKYQQSLNGMVEKQFNLSVKHLGDCWYSAWLEAGEPNLQLLNQ